jgi:multisubunit Na+/H+ antiporter MnhE subunit
VIALAVSLLGGLVWMGIRGSADLATFVVGAAVSASMAWATRIPWSDRPSPVRLLRGVAICVRILFRFAVDLVVANVRQLRIVLSPSLRVRPLWLRFTTRLERPATRIMLGVLISLTPGTVTQELRDGEYVIHVLDVGDEEDPLIAIRERFEALLLQLEAL